MKSPFLVATVLLSTGVSLAAHTIELINWVDRDWPRTLLHYDVELPPGEIREGATEVREGAHLVAPQQLLATERHADGSIKRARLSFYADLAKGVKKRFVLSASTLPLVSEGAVVATANAGQLEVTNSKAGVRIPAVGAKEFDPPVPASAVPAPILAFQLSDGTRAGRGVLESERQVVRWSQRIVAAGPLYHEYAYEVRFAAEPDSREGGYYKARIRVEAEQAVVHVAEEFDMRRATAGTDFFTIALNAGWKPDAAIWTSWATPSGSKEVQPRSKRPDDMGVFREPLTFAADREHTQFYPWRDYGTKANIYGLYRGAGGAESPFVGLISQHVGAWRLPDGALFADRLDEKGRSAREAAAVDQHARDADEPVFNGSDRPGPAADAGAPHVDARAWKSARA